MESNTPETSTIQGGGVEDNVLRCPYCGSIAKLIRGAEAYPLMPNIAEEYFWSCKPCDALVSCHKPSCANQYRYDIPKGNLANKRLRKLRSKTHGIFDPLWRQGYMSRSKAYVYLQKLLGMSYQECHIGKMKEVHCWRIINHFKKVDYAEMRLME